ncbi:MAG: VOC family protein [Chloroflexota bacterium]
MSGDQRLHLANITFDAADPPALARFWAAVTGRTVAMSEAHFAMLTSESDGIRWLFIKVPEGKTAKNRCHLDFHTANREAEVERLVALGATRGATRNEWNVEWTTLQDPEGNEFCVAAE